MSRCTTPELESTNHFELLKYTIDHDPTLRTTRVWYKNGYNETKVLMATYPWVVWGEYGAYEKAQSFKRTAVVPL